MASSAPADERRGLIGVRILALESSVSAPHCSRILADLGAEVIKVERRKTGDLIRGWDTVVHGLSSGFVWLNGNKRSFAIDLTKPSGRQIVRALAERVDVILENFTPGVAERLGLGAKELCSLNERLIYCSISGYGQDGPYRNVKAYDLLIQGETGVIATTGYPEAPAKVGLPITDLACSMYATVGILAALYQRERTERGQIIDISMFESAVSWLGYFPHYFWHRGEEPTRVGIRHHYVVPYGFYKAQDGEFVSFAVATPQDWEIFCRTVLRRPDLLEDLRFRTPPDRRKNRNILEELVEKMFAELPHEEWLRRLKESKLPYGKLNGIEAVLAHPQVAARNLVGQIESPVGPVPVIKSPLRMSETPLRVDPIPELGQDTEAILRELGYATGEIEALRGEEVI